MSAGDIPFGKRKLYLKKSQQFIGKNTMPFDKQQFAVENNHV
jgi:hypothetical protein